MSDINVDKTFVDGCVMVTYKPSDKEIEILRTIQSEGYMEFRSNYDIGMSNWLDQTKKIKLGELEDLSKHKFISQVEDAWHTTYELTELGKFYLDNI